jgi:hypothetical protein
MKTTKILPTTLALACSMIGAASAQTVPTSGAYVTDGQNTWVQDRVGDRISTVNMIMCIMGNLKPDQMVNKGPYLALVDQGKCKGQSDAGNASSTNAGETSSSKYMSAVVESTQAASSDPLVMKAWITDEEQDQGTTSKSLIYIYLEATAGKSTTNPNGLFKMYFCGTVPGTSTCDMKGTLKSDTSGLTFYEAENRGGPGISETKLKLQQADANGDSGIGKIQGADNGSFTYDFAYNPTNFRRNDGTTDVCFSRDQTQAEFSTWKYGVYKPDGSRLNMDHPGFPVKFVHNGSTDFGFWSFWGLSLPPSAMADIGVTGSLTRQVGGSDEALTVSKKGGKLWKFTRQAATLDDFKNSSLNYSACQATTNLPLAGDQPCTNYTLQWNGVDLQAVGKMTCGEGGCSPVPISVPVTLSASEFAAVGAKSLWIYSPAGDGVISVPASGNFSGTTQLFYRSRNVVTPGAAGAPSQLVCVNGCPTSYANTTPLTPWADITALTWGGGGSQTIPSSQNWGPVPASNAISYTYDGMLKRAGSAIDYSVASSTQMASFPGGLQSGYLIDGSDAAALASIKCDNTGAANSSGSNYCPWLANQATTSYQWETGPNQWNQYFGAANSAGPISFDPPKNLAFTVTSSNIRAADVTKFAGSTLQLQFSGFGELQGIPGSCVNPDNNQPVACGPGVRWVPAFDIKDASTVSEGTSTYYTKFLEREMRLHKLAGTGASACPNLSLTDAGALVLPGVEAWDVNPLTKIGSQPTLITSKPAVIQGVLQ